MEAARFMNNGKAGATEHSTVTKRPARQGDPMSISNIVETLRTGGAVDFSTVEELASTPVNAPPAIKNWQMNFNQNTLSESCEVTSKNPLLGVGLLAFSPNGETFYFGTYCSMTNPTDQAADNV